MRQALVLGTGGHCRVLVSLLADVGQHQILEILELGELRAEETIMEFPVRFTVGSLDRFLGYPDLDVFLAVGNNQTRRMWWKRIRDLGFRLPNLVSPHAIVDRCAVLGEANIVCAKAFIGPECRLGSNNLVNTGAIVEHEVQIGSHCHLAPASTIAGRSRVADECFVGAGATVIGGLSVAERTTLGAGCVLVRNVDQPDGTFVGVPASRRGAIK